MKGISPIVASVLLIALVVILAGIINLWISKFFSRTDDIKKDNDIQVGCSNAAIDIQNPKYCNNYFSGIIYNQGMVDLGNLTMYVFYQNGSLQHNDLNSSITSGSIMSFNMTMNNDYTIVKLISNCTGKPDEIKRNEISTC
jgi:flagellin-like protein